VGSYLPGIVVALLGLFTGLTIQWWKSNRDELRSFCDEFCNVVSQSSDAASQYWLAEEGDQQLSMHQVRVLGFQKRMSGYNALLINRLHASALDDVDRALAAYFDACTGGEFGAPEKSKKVEAANRVQQCAGDVILEIRVGFYETVTFQERIWRMLQHMWPLNRD